MAELDLAFPTSCDSKQLDPLFHLASSFLTARGQNKEEQLSKDRLVDLIGRAKVGDIEGLAFEAQLSNTDALRFARSVVLLDQLRNYDGKASFTGVASQPQTPTPTRQLLRTPDARKLARELLAIFANEASSKFASNRFLFLISPALDERDLEGRFNLCMRGRDIFNELQINGKLLEARRFLSTLAFSGGRQEKVAAPRKADAASKESNVIRYFACRRKMIEIAGAFLTGFSDIKSLLSFLLPAKKESEDSSTSSESNAHDSAKKTLTHVLKSLKEVEELGLPDAEGIVSDGEIAINDELQQARRRSSSLDREKVKELIEKQVLQISSTLDMNRDEESDSKHKKKGNRD